MRRSQSTERLLGAHDDEADEHFARFEKAGPASGSWRPRREVLAIAVLSFLLLVSWTSSASPFEPFLSLRSDARLREVEACSADAFNSGSWQRKQHLVNITDRQSYEAAAGFAGCAGRVGYYFANDSAVEDWPSYNEPLSWEWQPSEACQLVRPSMRERLQNLVDEGGLLLVGDSLTYQHFYSLSCELYPHVKWKNASINLKAEELGMHSQLQHLYLEPESPVVQELSLPWSFDMETRPVVSFNALYIPISTVELLDEPSPVTAWVPPSYGDNLVSDALYRSMPSSVPIDLFTDPAAHYHTMVLSFGAHIGPQNFPGTGWTQWLDLYRVSLRRLLRNVRKRMSEDQRVVMRAGTPGHDWGVIYPGPLSESPPTGGFYNWPAIPLISQVSAQETANMRDSRFQWMDGERISRTRPDAHVRGEGLHWLYGSGVMESYSMYLWHLLAVQ